jgi:hypothetical protein
MTIFYEDAEILALSIAILFSATVFASMVGLELTRRALSRKKMAAVKILT